MNFLQSIKQMFQAMNADRRSFFADPKTFWRNASPAFRVYIIFGSISDISLVLLILGVILSQLGYWGIAFYFIPISIIGLALGFLASIWEILRGGRRYAILGAIFLAVILAVPTANLFAARAAPPIHDISTDLKNPPQFDAIKKIRPPSANSLARKARGLKTMQRKAYPKVKTLRFYRRTLHPARVFEAARDLARDRGWDIIAADPKRRTIEATASTFFLNFKDDIVIRIGSRRSRRPAILVDMRSVSRIGRSDLGANAARITAFLGDLRQTVRKQGKAKKKK